MLYRFMQTRQPSPGTQSYAFEPRFALPRFLGVRGPGKYAGGYFNPLQPPQVLFQKTAPVASVASGGVVAGQIFGQPLLDKG